GCWNDAAEAARDGHRGWGNCQGLLPRVSARPECGRRSGLVAAVSDGGAGMRWPWPAPVDDGGADHLICGLALPDIALPATSGRMMSLARVPGRAVVFCYSWTGRPGAPNPPDWDTLPGAHGSTPEAEGFRDLYPGFA